MALVVRNSPTNAEDVRDAGSIPGSGRSPGGGHGNPYQHSSLGNSMDSRAWQATVRGVRKSQTWLKQLSTQARKGMIRVGVNLLILFLENFAMQKLYIKFPNLGWGAVANILAENNGCLKTFFLFCIISVSCLLKCVPLLLFFLLLEWSVFVF